MDYKRFYGRLFKPIQAAIGPIDRLTIVAIAGFDGGGPLNFCTIGAEEGKEFITYVSCELSVRPEQVPSSFGRYELLATCNDETWVRRTLSNIGRMSMEETFDHGHTLDLGPTVSESDPIQGVFFEKVCAVEIEGENYGILRCIGISRAEMEHAQEWGSASLIELLKRHKDLSSTDVLTAFRRVRHFGLAWAKEERQYEAGQE